MNETKAKKRRITLVVQKVKVGEQDKADLQYWLSLPPEERFEAVHQIRQEYCHSRYGSFGRLQRVYRIAKRS